MNRQKEYLKEGVRRLIEAASNPNLTCAQADVLMTEAKDNCDIAFCADSERHFSELVKEYIRGILDDLRLANER